MVLENEPKYIDPKKLTSFKVNAPHTQSSILEFAAFLRRNDGGYVKTGEEAGLDIGEGNDQSSRESTASQQDGECLWPTQYPIHLKQCKARD